MKEDTTLEDFKKACKEVGSDTVVKSLSSVARNRNEYIIRCTSYYLNSCGGSCSLDELVDNIPLFYNDINEEGWKTFLIKIFDPRRGAELLGLKYSDDVEYTDTERMLECFNIEYGKQTIISFG